MCWKTYQQYKNSITCKYGCCMVQPFINSPKLLFVRMSSPAWKMCKLAAFAKPISK